MAVYVWKDATISVNAKDLSDHCSQVTVEDTANEVDQTPFSVSAYSVQNIGLKDATITATFFQDFAASSVHATLQPLYASGGTFDVVVKPTSASASPTNPSVTLKSRLFAYGGIGGAVGDSANLDVSFRNAGTAGVVWGTA